MAKVREGTADGINKKKVRATNGINKKKIRPTNGINKKKVQATNGVNKKKVMATGGIDNTKTDDTRELEKSKIHIIVEIIEYMPNAVVSKTIIKKTTGNITVTSFDTGEESAEKISPFDTYIQIIDGAAEITIDQKKYNLKLGDGIVIPAHRPHCINAHEQFKMIATVIKSGYED